LPDSLDGILKACRLFVEHPIARMTGICAILRCATPVSDTDESAAPVSVRLG